MRILLAVGLIAVAAYLAPAAWYLFNIAMRNPTFAGGLVIAGLGLLLWGACMVAVHLAVSGRRLR